MIFRVLAADDQHVEEVSKDLWARGIQPVDILGADIVDNKTKEVSGQCLAIVAKGNIFKFIKLWIAAHKAGRKLRLWEGVPTL